MYIYVCACCERCVIYFVSSSMFTVPYPTSNDFLPQFMKGDSWVLRIPLNQQMTPSLILSKRHHPTPISYEKVSP